MKFTFNGDVTFNAGPEYLVTQWTQMGADVTLSNPDHTTYATTLITGKYDVSILDEHAGAVHGTGLQADQFPQRRYFSLGTIRIMVRRVK